jgi:hypothetical protein
LRSLSVGITAHFSKYDAASDDKLVPTLGPIGSAGADDTDTVDTDSDGMVIEEANVTDTQEANVTNPEEANTMDTDPDLVDTNPPNGRAEPDPSPSEYALDAVHLSDGPAAVLPCTIQHMDLTVLKLEHTMRVPGLVLIRDDWREVVDIFNGRRGGSLGAAAFTGQPGIGKNRYCAIFNRQTNLRR